MENQKREVDCTAVLTGVIDLATQNGLFKRAEDAMIALQSLGALNARIAQLSSEVESLKNAESK